MIIPKVHVNSGDTKGTRLEKALYTKINMVLIATADSFNYATSFKDDFHVDEENY